MGVKKERKKERRKKERRKKPFLGVTAELKSEWEYLLHTHVRKRHFDGHSPPRRVHSRREDEQEQDEGQACFEDGPGALLPSGRRRGRGAVRKAPRTHAPSSHVRRKAAPAGVRLLGDRPPPIVRQLETKRREEKKSPGPPSAQRCLTFGTSRIFSGVDHSCSCCVLPFVMFRKHRLPLSPRRWLTPMPNCQKSKQQ